MSLDIDKIRNDTPGVSKGIHLMACGSSLMPQPVIDAVVGYTLLEGDIGGYEAESSKFDQLELVYNNIAKHIGAKRNEISVLENATVAWANAFYALPLEPGSRILTCEAEYAANYVAFLSRAKKESLKIDIIGNDEEGALDLVELEQRMDKDVGLIAITWIPTNGGLVNPAEGIGKIAQKFNVPFLLDGCQAVGQMPIDVKKIGCDFFSATGRKFLRGPRGTGFLYVSERWLNKLHPVMIDHFGAPWVNKDEYQLRNDARRFETWENSYALRAGLAKAVEYASEIGIEKIHKRTWALAGMCRDLLQEIKGITVADLGREKCGIVSFYIDGKDCLDIVSQMREIGVTIGTSSPPSTLIDSQNRSLPMLLRASPHYYNTADEIEFFVSSLKRIS